MQFAAETMTQGRSPFETYDEKVGAISEVHVPSSVLLGTAHAQLIGHLLAVLGQGFPTTHRHSVQTDPSTTKSTCSGTLSPHTCRRCVFISNPSGDSALNLVLAAIDNR